MGAGASISLPGVEVSDNGTQGVYLAQHRERVESELTSAVNDVLERQPEDPVLAIAQRLMEKVNPSWEGACDATDKRYVLQLGKLSNFFAGLEALIGQPNPNLMRAMQDDHCNCADSDAMFETPNYHVHTCPRMEWWFVYDPERGLSLLGDANYPEERHSMPNNRRKARHPSDFEKKRRSIDLSLRQRECAPLLDVGACAPARRATSPPRLARRPPRPLRARRILRRPPVHRANVPQVQYDPTRGGEQEREDARKVRDAVHGAPAARRAPPPPPSRVAVPARAQPEPNRCACAGGDRRATST